MYGVQNLGCEQLMWLQDRLSDSLDSFSRSDKICESWRRMYSIVSLSPGSDIYTTRQDAADTITVFPLGMMIACLSSMLPHRVQSWSALPQNWGFISRKQLHLSFDLSHILKSNLTVVHQWKPTALLSSVLSINYYIFEKSGPVPATMLQQRGYIFPRLEIAKILV